MIFKDIVPNLKKFILEHREDINKKQLGSALQDLEVSEDFKNSEAKDLAALYLAASLVDLQELNFIIDYSDEEYPVLRLESPKFGWEFVSEQFDPYEIGDDWVNLIRNYKFPANVEVILVLALNGELKVLKEMDDTDEDEDDYDDTDY